MDHNIDHDWDEINKYGIMKLLARYVNLLNTQCLVRQLRTTYLRIIHTLLDFVVIYVHWTMDTSLLFFIHTLNVKHSYRRTIKIRHQPGHRMFHFQLKFYHRIFSSRPHSTSREKTCPFASICFFIRSHLTMRLPYVSSQDR